MKRIALMLAVAFSFASFAALADDAAKPADAKAAHKKGKKDAKKDEAAKDGAKKDEAPAKTE